MLPYPRKQKAFARRLRRTQTDAERRLWSRLRHRQICGAKFRRQHAVGPFITDFCCMEIGLVIELDGERARLLVFLDQTSRRGKDEATTAAAQLTVTARLEKDRWRIVDLKAR